MTSNKKTVCIGILGSTLDNGFNAQRWKRWRPSVALARHESMPVDRVELIHDQKHQDLANQVSKDIQEVSPKTDVVSHIVNFQNPWDFEEVYRNLHHFARTYPFNTEDEDYFVHITTGTHVAQICLFLLTESRHFPARLLQQSPPPKKEIDTNVGYYSVIDLDLSRYDQIFERFQQEQREGVSFLKGGIETKNEAFNHLISQIERVAISSQAPILLHGPTGAGKTQLARRIYELKLLRRQIEGAFVEVNCATLRGDGAMSALFGHVKGAYTGAVQSREGLLRGANGGVLFLDEIGELGLDEQTMLLRAVESGKFMPVGSDREVESSFQLLAGTNRDLGQRVRQGEFREDLLARIDMWTFMLPGLKERPEDIEPNLDFELNRYTERYGERPTMNKEARRAYLKFATDPAASWRGNFRDLNASVTRMATLAVGGRINSEVVEEELGRLEQRWQNLEGALKHGKSRHDEDTVQRLKELLGLAFDEIDMFDLGQLCDVVSVCRKSRSLSQAGRALFAHSRTKKKSSNDSDRLRKYLARYDLRFEEL